MKTKLLLLGALFVLLCATAQAQLTITANGSPPATGADDQYYLPGAVDEAIGAMTTTGGNNANSSANDVLTYVAADKASKGQSFTTGPNANGYQISSVTIRHMLMSSYLNNGTWASVPNGASFAFRFGTISGKNITPILTTTATYSGTAINVSGTTGSGTYLTIDLSSAGLGTLSPNTTYFFELASSSPYIELHNTRTNATSYKGGTAFYGNTTAALSAGGTVNTNTYGGEFAFVAKLTAIGAPTVVASVNPASAVRGQSFTVTATVTPSLGTVTNVSVNLSAIGGSASASLVLSNANVYTNTFTVPVGASLGNVSLAVSAKDTTPLTGTYGVAFTVLPANDVWSGGSLIGNTWSDTANWQGNIAPSAGDAVAFAGTTRLTPDMNNNYSISSLVFSNTAGSFSLSSSTGGTLTNGSGGIVNNSANLQILNVPVVLGAAQSFNAASGGLTLNSNITGGMSLTLLGTNLVTLAGAGSSLLGDLVLNNGTLKVSGGTVTVSATQGNTTIDNNSSVEVGAGATLTINNGNNSWFPLGDTSDTLNTLTINGGTVNVVNQWGMEAPRQGNAVLTINSGSMTVNDNGKVGLILGDMGTAQSSTVNLNGGVLAVNKITANNGVSTFYFNGGTLKPIGTIANFFPTSGTLTSYVRNGGAVVDTAGFNVTAWPYLYHSVVGGDNATDGGLTKTGNGSLTLSSGYGYTGPTKVLAGTLNLNLGLGVGASGDDLVVSNATLIADASSGTAMPAANVILNSGAILTLTNNANANAISGTGNLLVQTNTTLNLNYGSLGGNPTVAAINVAGSASVTGTNNLINIAGSGFVVGQFPLIKYNSGSLASVSGLKLGTLPTGVNAVLVNNTGNQSVDLNITLIGQTLTWYGTNADWNINSTYNWNSATAKYLEYGTSPNIFGDLVTFDDSLYNDFVNPQATNVNLTTALRPSQITVNSSLPYSFTGAGSIAGSSLITMSGSGSLTLGTANSYTGGTFANAGTLIVSNDLALGSSSSLLTLGGGTLQVAGNMATARLTTIAGNSTVDVLSNMTAQLELNGSAGGGSLTKIDNGILALSSAGASGIGDLIVNQGLLKVTNGTVIASATQGNSKIDLGANVEVNAGGTLAITNGVNAWFPLGDTAGTTNTLTVNGGTVSIVDNWGIEAPRQGNAILTINSGSMTVHDIGGIGLILGDTASAESGVLNLNGGTLTVNKITSNNGTNKFLFNGGTLKPVVGGTFFPGSAVLAAEVRNGGAVVDTAGLNATIGQALVHSTVAGDNATDGGLTKNGNGILTLTNLNTYTGGTVVNGGALQISTEDQLGVVPGSATVNITLNGGAIYNNNSTPALSANRTISLGAGGGYLQAGWSPNQGVIVNGQITGTGGLGINWDSSWVTLNAVNNYQGGTTIGTKGPAYWDSIYANPILKLGVDNALPYGVSAGNVVFATNANNNTATLDLNGHSAQINGLTGDVNAMIDNTAAGACVLTVGNNNQGGTFGGVIKNTAGTLALTKTGNGTLNLTGANTYTGNTTVNGGTLELAQAVIATNSTVSIASAAKLQLDFSTTNIVTAIVLNGVSQPAGIYNAANTPAYFAGTGSLIIPSAIASNPTNITATVIGGTLQLSWPADHLGWMVQSNSIDLAVPADWYDISNTASGTSYSPPIDATKANVFYRLRKP